MDQLRGTVIRRHFGAGTKSEHEAIMLETEQGTFRLRRLGGNPFHDQELDSLVGQEIVCRGNIHQGTVIMEDWQSV